MSRSVGSRARRLLLAFAIVQFGLHAGQVIASKDPRLVAPHGVAFLHDLLLLAVAWLAVAGASRLAPGRIRRLCEVGSLTGLFAVGLLLASYPRSLREWLAFPVNVLAADTETVGVFLREYLGAAALWPVALAMAAGIAAWFVRVRVAAPRWQKLPRWQKALRWAIPAFLALAGVATLPRRSPQPFVYSVQQGIGSWLRNEERAAPALKRPARSLAVQESRRQVAASLSGESTAKRVLLVVLEGVTSEEFEREFLALPEGFYARGREFAAYFRGYYATNLDSYTSLIAMLTSVQVPYRAYADESLYGAVNDGESLTRTLARQDFATLFISTYEHQPFVPTRSAWDSVMDRRDLAALDDWLSLGSNRMEAATEDRAALPAILDFVGARERAFVLHELVYGHSPEWRATTGKTQLQYYDEYLRELWDWLERAGLQEDTLLVVVSDHGYRAEAANAENYRVPLLVVGKSVRPSVDAALRCHLDLQGILAHFLTGVDLPAPRERIQVVGSSERWVYGEIDAAGAYLFLDDATGQVLAHSGSRSPAELHREFQATLDEFGARFGS